jgi:transposase InsO family protein
LGDSITPAQDSADPRTTRRARPHSSPEPRSGSPPRHHTHIHRIVTDNGACYRSNDFARIVGHRTRHQKTKPYTPRHNGKAER